MLSARTLQTNNGSPYRIIQTRQDYLRLLNLRRIKAHPDRTPVACLKVVSLHREGTHESR